MLQAAIVADRPASAPFHATVTPPRDAPINAVYRYKDGEMSLIHALAQTAPPELLDAFAQSAVQVGGVQGAVRFIIEPGRFFLMTENEQGLVMESGSGAIHSTSSTFPGPIRQ